MIEVDIDITRQVVVFRLLSLPLRPSGASLAVTNVLAPVQHAFLWISVEG